MSTEPDWLREQRKERQKSYNLMQGTFAGAAALPMFLAPIMAFPRTTLGSLGAVLYLLLTTAAIFYLAKRFTSRGEVLRYLAISLALPIGFVGLVLTPFALSM